MTPKQVELARHALGLKERSGRSYRNRFWAGEGHSDFPDWLAMVEAGDAVRQQTSASVNNDLFYLTRKGAEKALLPREKLDPEDFPDWFSNGVSEDPKIAKGQSE